MGFSREDIYRLLRSYKANVGRCAHLRVEIKYVESLSRVGSDELIEEMVFRSSGPTGMPSGSGISDPTARVAVEVSDRSKQIARGWGRDLEEMQIELFAKLRDCGYVDGWLQGLRDRERDVVQWHIVDGIVWDRIPDLFMEKYPGDTYSLEGVRKIQKRAMKKMQKMSE